MGHGSDSARTETADPLLGTTVAGKWRLDSLLGAGGAATVYAATHRNGNRVAIKLMRRHLVGEPDLVARFTREGQIGNHVAHPGVVRSLDDGTTDDGVPYLVMELLEGESLGHRIDGKGPLPTSEAVRIVDAILDVLSAAHAAGLVHRDIKPENVFVTCNGAVKLLDFGIAGRTGMGRAMRGETLAGVVLGTPAFMPPEQARGRWDEVDARSDLWAVGATLFTALTRRHLRSGETAAEELLAAMSPVEAMSIVAPEIPAPVGSFLDRALASCREDRFDNAHAMRLALGRAIASVGPERKTQHGDGSKRWMPRWLAVRFDARRLAIAWIAAGGLALGSLLVFAAFGRPRAPVQSVALPPLPPLSAYVPSGPQDTPVATASRLDEAEVPKTLAAASASSAAPALVVTAPRALPPPAASRDATRKPPSGAASSRAFDPMAQRF